jgi:hypothetical protein
MEVEKDELKLFVHRKKISIYIKIKEARGKKSPTIISKYEWLLTPGQYFKNQLNFYILTTNNRERKNFKYFDL